MKKKPSKPAAKTTAKPKRNVLPPVITVRAMHEMDEIGGDGLRVMDDAALSKRLSLAVGAVVTPGNCRGLRATWWEYKAARGATPPPTLATANPPAPPPPPHIGEPALFDGPDPTPGRPRRASPHKDFSRYDYSLFDQFGDRVDPEVTYRAYEHSETRFLVAQIFKMAEQIAKLREDVAMLCGVCRVQPNGPEEWKRRVVDMKRLGNLRRGHPLNDKGERVSNATEAETDWYIAPSEEH